MGLWLLAPLLLLGWVVFFRPFSPEVSGPPQAEPPPPSQPPPLESIVSRLRPPASASAPADRLARAVCDTPIGWRIGVVDPGFGLQEWEVYAAVEGAVALWERAAGRQLFVYQPSGGMPIDLVYDRRQQRLTAWIQEKERLTRWESHLSTEPMSQREADHLRLEIALYIEAVGIFNRDPLGSFKAGEYSQERNSLTGRVSNRRIRIFTVAGEADLISTLAHEMGHALGLGHVSDPLAIMASVEEMGSRARPVIRPADLEEFYRRCGGAP